MTSPAPPGRRYRLALFPLPVVLLPGTAMPLHIFEPRYRALVADCLQGDRRFGMVFHDWDEQGPFLSEEGRIGCVAEIGEHQLLDDGRSLIAAHGVERFRIEDGIESSNPYFEALVTPYRDGPEARGADLARRRRASIDLFHAVVASLPDTLQRLPELEPEREVSFLLARAIQADPMWHQGLLELRDESERLDQLDAVLRAVLG